MTELNLWLESPDSPPVSLKVGDNILVSQLKAELTARSHSPYSGPDSKLPGYEIVCLRTGTILRGDTSTIAYLVRDGDRFMLREASGSFVSDTESEAVIDAPQASVDNASLDNEKIGSFDRTFSITGIKPFFLDFTAEYPVFAIKFRSTFAGNAITPTNTRRSSPDTLLPRGKTIYAKDYYFLTADKNGKFKWVPMDESSQYLPGYIDMFREHGNRRSTRYGLGKDEGERKNMIYPIRPFSITGITMDGFDLTKEYPVLAIDTDQFIKNQESEEDEVQEPQSSTQSIAFFLVGDDNGEFAWIAEDECRLYPLKN